MREAALLPSKAMGQHFLHDQRIVSRIVELAQIDGQVVVEVGPGFGILTRKLAAVAGSVIAIEKDRRLAARLELEAIEGVRVIEADALTVDYPALAGSDYHVVANLPYSVGTAIVGRLQESLPPPRTLTIMVQREVAERMVARPPRMNLLGVAVQYHGSPQIVLRVGRGAFTPPPKVESAVVRITTYPGTVDPLARRRFFSVVRVGFSQPRKQVVNPLTKGLGLPRDHVSAALERAGLRPTQRAEQLTLDDWRRLVEALGDPLG
jgi:16S rRNA (adenine1518-N6/adenine1519-N6)-dimethyltransferase